MEDVKIIAEIVFEGEGKDAVIKLKLECSEAIANTLLKLAAGEEPPRSVKEQVQNFVDGILVESGEVLLVDDREVQLTGNYSVIFSRLVH